MTHVLSENAVMYFNAGTYAAPTWTEISNIKDVTLNLEGSEVDVSTRASGGWTENVQGLCKYEVSIRVTLHLYIYLATQCNCSSSYTITCNDWPDHADRKLSECIDRWPCTCQMGMSVSQSASHHLCICACYHMQALILAVAAPMSTEPSSHDCHCAHLEVSSSPCRLPGSVFT